MDYSKIYNSLITRAKTRCVLGYNETHHIIPKCIGGSDAAINLVELTPEEHFIAHLLLVKIYPNKKGLIFAVNMMCKSSRTNKRPNRKMYGWLKRRFSTSMREQSTGETGSQYGKRFRWITDGVVCRRLYHNEDIPIGWCSGLPKRAKHKCNDCGFIMNKKRKRCGECHSIFIKNQTSIGDAYRKVTDDDICNVLIITQYDYIASAKILGWKSSTGNNKYRLDKCKKLLDNDN